MLLGEVGGVLAPGVGDRGQANAASVSSPTRWAISSTPTLSFVSTSAYMAAPASDWKRSGPGQTPESGMAQIGLRRSRPPLAARCPVGLPHDREPVRHRDRRAAAKAAALAPTILLGLSDGEAVDDCPRSFADECAPSSHAR